MPRCNGGDTDCDIMTRERADFLLVSNHKITWQIGLIGSADDGASWCNPKHEFDVGRR